MDGFLIDVLIQGLLYGVMSLGVLISYKVLDFADLSVDGTFPLGAAVSAMLIVNGVNPWLALAASLLAGVVAGFITGFLHVKLKIEGLLAGILVMTGLYSVNLMVAGGSISGSVSNIGLYNFPNIFTTDWLVALGVPNVLITNYRLIVLVVITLLIKLVIDWVLKTRLGYLMKVTGDNEGLVAPLGHSVGTVKIVGLALSNGIVALSGGLAASVNRYYDITIGQGMIVLGLSSVILGTTLLRKFRFNDTTKVIVGAIAYRMIVALAIKNGLEAQHMKLMTVIIFVAVIIIQKSSLKTFVAKYFPKANKGTQGSVSSDETPSNSNEKAKKEEV